MSLRSFLRRKCGGRTCPSWVFGVALIVWLALERAVARMFFVEGLYWRHLAWLVGRTDLFDERYYLESNADVAAAGCGALRHYVAHGDREGRQPMPLFDPGYYRAHLRGPARRANALLHYARVGRFERIPPSPLFDVAFYLEQNLDVARSGVDPLLHYLNWGGLEGRSPCAQFDGSYYLRTNPDVAEARVNPLIHFLNFGRIEGRETHAPYNVAPEPVDDAPPPVPSMPAIDDWSTFPASHDPAAAMVDVVVPVYKGRAETLRCIYSVLAGNNATPYELIVIDDASPDADLKADLTQLAARGFFTLQANEENLGFVQTVNRGMRQHAGRDVILLNSDAEVYGDWIDRLRQAARRHERTGTVTPLSNNATICSYPRFLHDNPYPLEMGYERLDALAASSNAGFEVEAPTAVGFCMYIRRDCLDDTGYFDEAAFGKGYGEENDFCQRAIRKGWRNVIAADVFVRHWGSTSFQGEKAVRVQAALRTIGELYPNYAHDVRAFVEDDPLAEARRRLDWARLCEHSHAQNVLIVCHNRGGGSERHVQEDTRDLLAAGVGVFFLRPQPGRLTHVRIGHPACKQVANLKPFDLRDTAALAQAMRELHITRIHTHGLIDLISDAPVQVLALARALKVPMWIDIHDYKVICPRINLVDRDGRYCGEPIEAACDRCLATVGSDFGVRDIRAWREMHGDILRSAEKVWVPDQDVADRLARYFPDAGFTVSPHEDMDFASIDLHPIVLAPGERLRIVIIGAIGKIKGYDVLLACARDAKKRKLPIDFIVLGFSMADAALQAAGVHLTGRYREEEAADKLKALAPHVVWLPSLWPETYSYTLSIALSSGYPVFAFDIGAIARRLRESGCATGVMPLALADSPARVNDWFLASGSSASRIA